jgi:hypothetical protein
LIDNVRVLPAAKLRELRTDSVRQELKDFLEWVDDAGGTGDGAGGEYLERVLSRFQLDRTLVLSDRVHRRRQRADFRPRSSG